jgi:hypothetical protein
MAEDTRTPWVMSFRNFKSNVKFLNTVLSIIILCPTILLLADSSWGGENAAFRRSTSGVFKIFLMQFYFYRNINMLLSGNTTSALMLSSGPLRFVPIGC